MNATTKQLTKGKKFREFAKRAWNRTKDFSKFIMETAKTSKKELVMSSLLLGSGFPMSCEKNPTSSTEDKNDISGILMERRGYQLAEGQMTSFGKDFVTVQIDSIYQPEMLNESSKVVLTCSSSNGNFTKQLRLTENDAFGIANDSSGIRHNFVVNYIYAVNPPCDNNIILTGNKEIIRTVPASFSKASSSSFRFIEMKRAPNFQTVSFDNGVNTNFIDPDYTIERGAASSDYQIKLLAYITQDYFANEEKKYFINQWFSVFDAFGVTIASDQKARYTFSVVNFLEDGDNVVYGAILSMYKDVE